MLHATNAARSLLPLSISSTDVYAYNARSEVIGAGIETNDYAYTYDGIGNSLFTSLNTLTNAYTVNNLNQYKAITNLVDLSGYKLQFDADGNMTHLDKHTLSYDAENRLAAYTFGTETETGTLRSAYSYDHLSRRVKKMGQDYREYDPGGITPSTFWWNTNEVTTFVYDGWNPIHERVAHTNGTVDSIEYVWGLDLSGTRQGAGGVGGLLFEKRNGVVYIPCYDANGNITAYIDTNCTVRAYRQFDAFGNTVAKGGDMVDVFHFWYSTKYFDHDTGLYYYGYRYYSPVLQRWINRDPIEEEGGVNLFGFIENNPLSKYDYLGLWKRGDTIDNGNRRIYIRDSGDTFETLARLMRLDLNEIHKWAKIVDDGRTADGKKPCKVSVPNIIAIFTSKPSAKDVSASVVSHYRKIAELLVLGFKEKGYKVVPHKNSTSVADFMSLWNLNGIYGIVYAGHGGYPSGLAINPSDFNGIIFPNQIKPKYKLAMGIFYACYSDARDKGDLSNLGSWRDHIAIKDGAMYLGFPGLTCWWSDPNVDNPLNGD